MTQDQYEIGTLEDAEKFAIIRMAREAGFQLSDNATDESIAMFERFAALVAAHAREKNESYWKYNPETGEPLIDGWPIFSCLPPAKDVDKDKIIEGLTKLLELQTKSEEVAINMIEAAVLAEREACAKVCEEGVDTEHPIVKGHIMKNFGISEHLAAAIRARSQHD